MEHISKLLKEHYLSNAEATDKNGNTILHILLADKKFAVKETIKILEILLNKGVDLNIKNKNDETVLHLAIRKREKDVIDFLLKNQPNIDLIAHFVIIDEFTKFHNLSKQHKLNELDEEIQRMETESHDFIAWLISRGINFDCRNEFNESAVLLAVDYNLQHILPTLLKYTKDINFVNKAGKTLLHLFLETDDYFGINKTWYGGRYAAIIVKILLDRGLSVYAEDKLGICTPIQIAIENYEDIDIVMRLVEHSTNIDHKNVERQTAFNMVMWHWSREKEDKDGYYKKIAHALLAKGADINLSDKHGKRPVHYAVEEYNLSAVEFLQENEADIDLTGKDNLMHLFIKNDCHHLQMSDTEKIALFQILLERSTNINQKHDNGVTVFYTVIKQWARGVEAISYIKMASALIAKGAHVNEPDKYGKTPLCLAIENSNLQAVEFLRENGADFNTVTEEGETMLHLLVKSRYSDVPNYELDVTLFDLLLEQSTNMKQKNSRGKTVLYMVIEWWVRWERVIRAQNDYFTKFARALIARGADINEPNEYGKTPLCLAIEDRNLQIVEFLRENGADFNTVTKNGETLLHVLVESRTNYNASFELDMILFDLLLEQSTNMKQANFRGETVFYTVIDRWVRAMGEKPDYFTIARALIAKGADINQPDEHGKTPLCLAIEHHNLQIVEFLRENGADFNTVTKDGETLLHLLVKSRADYSTRFDIDMILFDLLIDQLTNIKEANSEGKTVFYAVIMKWSMLYDGVKTDYYMKIAGALVAKGADVNKPDGYGKSPLCLAVEHSNLQIVEFLRENGADFSVATEDGETLMHLLVKNNQHYWIGNVDAMKIKLLNELLSNGCQMEAKDKKGLTPLHLAVNHCSLAIVKKLIEHGADVNSRNNEMQTPLIYLAANQQEKDITKLLLEKGANVDAKDLKGFTALHAISANTTRVYSSDAKGEMITLLLAYGANFNERVGARHSVLCIVFWQNYDESKRKNHQVGNDGLPSHETCLKISKKNIKGAGILLKHWIKLNLVNLIDNEYSYILKQKKYKQFIEKCLQEIQILKNTFVDSNTTLYSLLHMDPNRRRFYANNEKLQQFVHSSKLKKRSVHSSKLKKQFPEYAVLVSASYHEAAARRVLLEPAIEAWLELTEIDLPDICIERIISFLSNGDLYDMIGQKLEIRRDGSA